MRPDPGTINVVVDSVQAVGSKARKKLVSELQLQQRHYIMDATVKELDRKLGDDTGKVCMAWIAWAKTLDYRKGCLRDEMTLEKYVTDWCAPRSPGELCARWGILRHALTPICSPSSSSALLPAATDTGPHPHGLEDPGPVVRQGGGSVCGRCVSTVVGR